MFPPSVRRAARARLGRRPDAARAAVPDFLPWLARVSPEYDWSYPHIAHLIGHLADVTAGRCRRLVVNMPAQHGKSQLLAIRYPLWRLAADPRLRVAVTAYGQRLANKFSRAARRIARESGFAFGDVEMADEWEAAAGGSFLARGMGAGITGNPVDLLVVDDPYKDARQANSATYREAVWEWWTDALEKRLSKDAAVVVLHTRWHTDDLTGRLLAGDPGGWRHVRLTALAEPGDPLGRAEGEPLCPALHPREQLEGQRRANPRSFMGMGQQTPVDKVGGFFVGLERVRVLAARPGGPFRRQVRFWDLAATEAQAAADPDYAVGLLLAEADDRRLVVLDVARDRLGPKAVRRLIRQTAERDGSAVEVLVEREGGASGKMVADAIVTEDLAGFRARAVVPDGSKAERAEPWASQVEAGNVAVVRAAWNDPFFAEHRAFPIGTHDDIVDAASGAFRAIARRPAEVRVIG